MLRKNAQGYVIENTWTGQKSRTENNYYLHYSRIILNDLTNILRRKLAGD